MKIYLKEPTLEEYWYEQQVLSDPLAMEYNAGWDVSYDGYHYDTGCIDFPKEKWNRDFEKRKELNRYFAYIVRKEDDKFIGYVNFHFNEKENKYECGVLVEPCHRGYGYGKEALKQLCNVAFNSYNVDSLYDNFEENRNSSEIFTDLGFKKIREYNVKRFNKDIKIIEICLKKEDFLD
ncbi:MAG: GNAT family N-acetyltransferase [Mollicutes bacterium]|nr:GNAT family N-acetyltransferase [Mollicutes bacterium]